MQSATYRQWQDTKPEGDAGEQLVLRTLTSKGYDAWLVDYTNHEYDIEVRTFTGEIVRIEVKSSATDQFPNTFGAEFWDSVSGVDAEWTYADIDYIAYVDLLTGTIYWYDAKKMQTWAAANWTRAHAFQKAHVHGLSFHRASKRVGFLGKTETAMVN